VCVCERVMCVRARERGSRVRVRERGSQHTMSPIQKGAIFVHNTQSKGACPHKIMYAMTPHDRSQALLIEYRARLIEYRTHLIEYRALLIEHRALLIEHRALFILIVYRALLIKYRSLLIRTQHTIKDFFSAQTHVCNDTT